MESEAWIFWGKSWGDCWGIAGGKPCGEAKCRKRSPLYWGLADPCLWCIRDHGHYSMMPRLCFCWTIVELLGSHAYFVYQHSSGHDIAWSPSRFGKSKETAQWLHMVFTSWPYLASLLPVGFLIWTSACAFQTGHLGQVLGIRFGPEMSPPVSGKPNGKTFPSKVVPQGILHFTCSTFTNLTIVMVTINPTVKLAINQLCYQVGAPKSILIHSPVADPTFLIFFDG